MRPVARVAGDWHLQQIEARFAALPRQRLRSALPDKCAAVLVPLCLDDQLRPAVLLCVRAAGLRSHAGEICFPGGRTDPTDKDAASTALREAEEELGIDSSDVRVLGKMN